MVNNDIPKDVVHQTNISVPCTGQLCLHVKDFFFHMRNENQGKKEKGKKKEKKEKKRTSHHSG